MRRSPFLPLLSVLFVSSFTGLTAQEPQASAPSTTEVTVNVSTPKPIGIPAFAKADGIAKWFGPEKVAPVHFQIEAGSPSTLRLRPGRWVLSLEIPAFWSAPYQLELRDKPAQVTLTLWRAGTIEGGFISDQKVKAPSELTVFFRPAPGSEKDLAPPISKSACPVEHDSWRCKVPAGILDLRFQSSGFVPRYLWGVHIEVGGTAHPGRLDLRPGSAVQGWVITADGVPIGDRGTVTLRPRISGPLPDAVERKRLEALHFEATINPHGFFQVEGVPPGAYLLEAHHERYAPAITSVRVVPGEVTEVANPPLRLEAPKAVEVFIDPPLDPAGQPWTVKLQKLDRDSSVVETFAEKPAGPDGSWKRSGVPPGNYLARVSRSGGETWWDGGLTVDENLAPLYVTMDLVTVKGTVSYGDAPLSAKVQFGGRWGATRIEAQSNGKGYFEVLLPKAGFWPVSVHAEHPVVEREIPKLKIEPKPGTKVAEVELKLPNTVLRGSVVDEKNAPIPKAIVSAMSNGKVYEDRVQTWTDDDGHFEIRGLLAGPTLVEADAGDTLAADPVSIDVEGGEDSKSWILVARPRLRLSGIVTSAAGPVAGARITAAPAGIPYVSARSVTSDAQGHFEIHLPRAASEMLLSVRSPGFAYRMLRMPVPESRTFGVTLDQTGGTLVVEKEGEIDYMDPNAPTVGVLHGGSVDGLATLTGWALAAGISPKGSGRTVIPSLEPGTYQACLLYPAEWVGLDFGIVPRGRCASGTLTANGELVLKIPSTEPDFSR